MTEVKKIIIVDDQSMIRKALKVLINLFPGYEVVLDVPDGTALQQQLTQDLQPDIILVDVVMPNMDGYETAAWIKNNFPAVCILALSTMDTDISIMRMIRNGARGYILKDAEPSELKLAFDEVLRSGYYYNDSVSRKLMRNIHAFTDRYELTDREIQFLQLACSDLTYKEIAAQMFLSEKTVDGYRASLFEKLQVKSRVGMALEAVRNKLVNF